jgi:hypothetical protein
MLRRLAMGAGYTLCAHQGISRRGSGAGSARGHEDRAAAHGQQVPGEDKRIGAKNRSALVQLFKILR